MPGKKNFLSKALMQLAVTAFSLFKLVPKLINLIEYEAHAASKSIALLLVLYLLAGCLLTCTWLCVLVGCTLYLVSLHLSWTLSFSVVIVMNVLLIVIVALFILRVKNNLSFPKTRNILRNI